MTSKLDKARMIAGQLRAAGATHCLLVGGFVRDHLLGIESKDLDIEVYGLSYAQIADALRRHHRVDLVGRSFGVVKVGNEIDISSPRSGLGESRRSEQAEFSRKRESAPGS